MKTIYNDNAQIRIRLGEVYYIKYFFSFCTLLACQSIRVLKYVYWILIKRFDYHMVCWEVTSRGLLENEYIASAEINNDGEDNAYGLHNDRKYEWKREIEKR
ncbi:5888_t:CDS:2 [Ambispora gerdemannii]|uniref:5888_t:CDS:1 n=1 Tax=Ambispora gerdemannii TaxID=144530 RepID=A0A9N9BEA9_9GLOM|nr:5888_t:CDS:2 [Ambispora gerdemannii]